MGDAVKAIVDPFGLFSKPKVPQAPKLKPPAVVDPAMAAKQAQLAADKKKKAALGAYGTEDTLLTGPLGLAPVPSANLTTKTLLGS